MTDRRLTAEEGHYGMSDIIFEHRTEFVPKEKLEGALEESARLRLHAEKLAEALERIVDEGPICFPEDRERCHCCEGTEEHGHAGACDWLFGNATLRAYREASR